MERIYHIAGTHCRACQILLEQRIGVLPGVSDVRVNFRNGSARVRFADELPADESAIDRAVTDAGYRLTSSPVRRTLVSHNPLDWHEAFAAVCIVLVLYFIYRFTGLDRLGAGITAASTAGGALVVGLVAGVSTCMALIGSLVLALSAQHAAQSPHTTAWQRIRPNAVFNLGRVAGFAVLGGLAGLLGSAFGFHGRLLGLLVVAAGLLMVLLGAQLTGLFPRLQQFSLPSKFARMVGVGDAAHRYRDWRALWAGALTFFLPCAFTQTMQVLAVSTGSFLQGALVMSAFALGTAPGLLAIGSVGSFAKGNGGRLFMKVAGVAVLLLGIWNMGNGWNLTGITLGSGDIAAIGAPDAERVAVAELRDDGRQYVATEQNLAGYEPARLRVKAGIPVVWTVTSTNAYTCAASIYIPSLKISRNLQEGPNTIEFTPQKPGLIRYSCSMGMYTGGIEVVE